MEKLVLKYMLEYQKNNNIINNCITNTQYFRDAVVGIEGDAVLGMEVKVLPAICISRRSYDDFVINTCHLCCVLNGAIIEPSYEIANLGKVYKTGYYHTIKDFMNCPFNNIKWRKRHGIGFKLSKEQITRFIKFTKYANDMNDNIALLTSDSENKDYYNKQADYVENKIRLATRKKYRNKCTLKYRNLSA